MQHNSKKRQKILDCLRATPTHPTAAWIYDQLREDLPGLSLGTVYRNLNQLKECGVIRSMGVVAGYEHFDGDIRPHPHAICRVCGAIVDLPPGPTVAELMRRVQTLSGIAIDEVKFSGICDQCQSSDPFPAMENII